MAYLSASWSRKEQVGSSNESLIWWSVIWIGSVRLSVSNVQFGLNKVADIITLLTITASDVDDDEASLQSLCETSNNELYGTTIHNSIYS